MDILKKLSHQRSITSYAIFFIVTLIIFSLLIPILSPYAEDLQGAVHFEIANKAPTLSHWFGTDAAGRDVFTLTIGAALSSIKIAIMVVFISIILGVPLGLIAGSIGGWLDEIIMRITDAQLSIPMVILAISILGVSRPNLASIISPSPAGE